MEAVRNASTMLGDLFDGEGCSAVIASKVHRRTYDILGTDDPYEALKREANVVALDLYPIAEEFVKGSKDALRASFLASVVGNVLDFGIALGLESPSKLRSDFRSLLDEGLGHDDTAKIRKLMQDARSVVYLADNCGEVVLDRLALKELRRFDAEITFVVKEKAILTDATLEDIQGLGIEELVDQIIEAPGFAVGIDLDSIRGKFGKMLEDADLIIAKGMGNFEALSETDLRPIAYLLRTKCSPVADAMRLKKGINAVKLFDGGGKR